MDGVYLCQAAGTGALLFHTERGEALRGPQGTLFDRNATAGLVQYISNTSTEFERIKPRLFCVNGHFLLAVPIAAFPAVWRALSQPQDNSGKGREYWVNRVRHLVSLGSTYRDLTRAHKQCAPLRTAKSDITAYLGQADTSYQFAMVRCTRARPRKDHSRIVVGPNVVYHFIATRLMRSLKESAWSGALIADPGRFVPRVDKYRVIIWSDQMVPAGLSLYCACSSLLLYLRRRHIPDN